MTILVDRDVTQGADEPIVAAIVELLEGSGSDGLPLVDVLQVLREKGIPVFQLGPRMTQLIREGRLDLTTDRRLRVAGTSAQ